MNWYQDTFNKVCEHLMKQGHPSKDGEGCAYLDKETGDKCAVGCLLSHYKEHWEGCGISTMVEAWRG
jgi:hypothetical protein